MTSAPVRARAARFGAGALAAVVLLCGLTLLLGYANKARCTGPEFTPEGRSFPGYDIRADRDVCYSDIQHLWITRELYLHNFPYLSGGISPQGAMTGGNVEYPVLSGVLIWLGGLGADTDAGFLLGSALLMAPFGLATAWMLGRLSRWRALLWSLGPPLVLYAFHNWDLPAVACAVGAVWVLHSWRTDRPLIERASVAAVLLGLGFAFKVYPAAFVLPLAAYVLTADPKRYDVAGAVRVCLVAAGTAVLVNLPFAVLGYPGWRASITFQQLREVDITTNSIWYWGLRPFSAATGAGDFQSTMDVVSPVAVLAAFALALGLGWRCYRHNGDPGYPWVAVSGAMLCGFLLLHKVHSPQYTLWLLPFFVLLRVHWGLIAGYLLADLAIGIGIFRLFYALDNGLASSIYNGFAAQAVVIGVWGRAALLVVLFFAFLRSHGALCTSEERR